MKRLLVWSMVAFGGFGQTIQVHGHRGARAMRPENTLPAFEYAIAQGVDALELDMAVTRDNVIVVSHDPVLRGAGLHRTGTQGRDPRTHSGAGPRVGLRREAESGVS